MQRVLLLIPSYEFLKCIEVYELNVQERGGVYDLKFSHIGSNQVPFVLSRKPFADVLEMKLAKSLYCQECTSCVGEIPLPTQQP